MDNRGWVPISLIASFNRVKQLTVDERLVKEVLILSTVVEVRGEWVRMSRWEQFVLPNARVSTVEDSMPSSSGEGQGYRERQMTEGYVLVGEDEDDEDEVEFVMG
jgi:la-related protein 1